MFAKDPQIIQGFHAIIRVLAAQAYIVFHLSPGMDESPMKKLIDRTFAYAACGILAGQLWMMSQKAPQRHCMGTISSREYVHESCVPFRAEMPRIAPLPKEFDQQYGVESVRPCMPQHRPGS